MSNITVESLQSDRSKISTSALRKAAEAWDLDHSAVEPSKRDIVELENTRSNAIEAMAQDKLDGKPAKDHLAAHDKKLDEARIAHRFAMLKETQSLQALQAACAEHGPAELETVEKSIARAETAYRATLAKLQVDYRAYAAAVSIGRPLGSEHLKVEESKLDRQQLRGIELALGSSSSWPIYVNDLLNALEAVGTPDANPTPKGRMGIPHAAAKRIEDFAKAGHRITTDADVRMRQPGQRDPGADKEISEREAELEHLNRQLGEDILAGRR